MTRSWMFLAVGLWACGSDDGAGGIGSLDDAGEPVPDAATNDAGPTGDGGTDAKTDGDASFVPGSVVFSDDFSGGDFSKWDVVTIGNGTTGEIDMGAFHVKTKAIAAQEADFAHLRK